MAITSENISGNTGGTNSGYVTNLILINKKDIISIVDPTYDGNAEKPFTVLNGNVIVQENAEVFQMRFRTKSCGWSETTRQSTDGIKYISSFSFDFPKNDFALASFFHQSRLKTWVAIWSDANGKFYITGDADFGLQLIIGRGISNGTNSTTVSLVSSSWHQSWFLESIDLNILSQSTFNEDFSEDFDVGY